MTLGQEELERIKRLFARAWGAEKPALDERRAWVRQLKEDVRELELLKIPNVAFVAADGGDNRIRLGDAAGHAPAIVEIVRVVDSENDIRVEEIIPGEAGDDFFSRPPESGPVADFCGALGCRSVADLRLSSESAIGKKAMRDYREIVEWAVLYELLRNKNPGQDGPILFVREGPLRARIFRKNIFEALDKLFREECEKRRARGGEAFLVGVAKKTRLLDHLRLALSLEDMFEERARPCYAAVRREIADKFYQRRWLDTMETADDREYLSMAQMCLVKFGDHPSDPVWPVDVAFWQRKRAGRILGCLAEDARRGFPVPDFPLCIQAAHDCAKIGGIEMSYLRDMLGDVMTDGFDDPKKRERVLRALHLGEDLAALRYRDE